MDRTKIIKNNLKNQLLWFFTKNSIMYTVLDTRLLVFCSQIE